MPRKHLLIALPLLVWATSSQAVILPTGPVNPVDGERIPGVLIVNFKPGHLPAPVKAQEDGLLTGIPEIDALNAQFGMIRYRPLFPGADPAKAAPGAPDLRGYHVLDFGPAVDLDLAAGAYREDPHVTSVEFDFYAYMMRTPNDTQFSQMWGLHEAGDNDIDAPEAWDQVVGDPNVVLADTDTGVLYTHEDLRDNIWVNPGEDLDSDGVVYDTDDLNGIDDDGNGYIDDLIGWDFVAGGNAVWPGEDGSIEDNDPEDFNGHGTHTSGTIAATTNNATGVAGVAGGFGPGVEDGCKIMCLRMGYSFNDGGGENGRTHMSYVAKAFRYAADNGAVAINYSFGSSTGGGIEAATDYAVAAGVVISASAGNSNNSFFGYLQSRDDVLCVASTTSSDRKSSFSNYGPEVDVSAPGSLIRSTVSNHYNPSYATYSGTSMAAPHVVGLVGLMKSLNPNLTREEVVDRIISRTDNIDHLNPTYAGLLGSGRINAAAMIVDPASTDFTATPTVGEAPLTVDFTDLSATAPIGWSWDFGDSDSAFVQHPTHIFDPGIYDISLRTETAIGDGFAWKTNFVAALAETLTVADAEGERGLPVVVKMTARNNLPVTEIILPISSTNVGNDSTAQMDSIVTTGCRTEYFEQVQYIFDGRFYGDAAIRLLADDGGGAPPLAPGSGPIIKVWFTMKPDATPANPVVVSTDPVAGRSLEFVSTGLTFAPVAHPGTITIPYALGDLNFDGVFNVFDVVIMVDVVFREAVPPEPASVVDVNCDTVLDVLDVVILVGTVFRENSPPLCP